MNNRTYRQISIAAMTLVEVMVALAVVSFVFISLTQMTFNHLKQAKKLELQDKMRSYATEAVQVIYNAKDSNWEGIGGFTKILPPTNGTATSEAYVTYGDKPTLQQISETSCSFNSQTNVLVGGGCEATVPPETSDISKIFGRVIVRTDMESGVNAATSADVQVIVACIEGKCSPADFAPFILSLRVFRTGGSQ